MERIYKGGKAFYYHGMYLTVLKQLVIMLLIAVFAFIFSKRNRFGDAESNFLSRLMIYFVNPFMIFNSFNMPFDAHKLGKLGFVILVSLLSHLLMTLVVTVFVRSKTDSARALDGLDRVGIVFTNAGFIGIPLINGVFGQEGVFYLCGYLAVFNVYLWMYGEYQMSHSFKIKNVITNPNVLAVIFGLVLFCLPFTLPQIIAKPVGYISSMNTALSMFLLGLLFATFKKASGVSYTGRLVKAVVLRLVVCSLANLLLLFAVWKLFAEGAGFRTELFVVFIASLCPVGMSVSSFACVFKKDASYTSLLVLSTSALCILTVPLFIRLAEVLLALP